MTTIPTTRAWHHFDAEGKILGRLATEAVTILRGKHKVSFRPHIDNGDIVVITNASKVLLSGKKESTKVYRHHTGYPGGLRTISASKLRLTKPEELVIRAISGMLPKTRLRDEYLKRLKVYANAEHPHKANIA